MFQIFMTKLGNVVVLTVRRNEQEEVTILVPAEEIMPVVELLRKVLENGLEK